MMRVGVGYCNDNNAFLAGKVIAEEAMEKGNIEIPSLVFAFCHGQLDDSDFMRGLRSVVGNDVPILGGSAAGIITNDFLCYENHPAGAAVLASDTLNFMISVSGDLDGDELLAGKAMARKLPAGPEDKLLFILYDSIKIPGTESSPPVMNASPPLIRGIEDTLKPGVPVLGAGVVSSFGFGPTRQFCGSYTGAQSVVGVLMGGDFEPYYRIMHGCAPKDGVYHTITKIDGPVIYELDGRPVVEIIDEMYGSREWRTQNPVKRLTLGVNMGERFSEFKEGAYVNRLIAGVLPDGDGIVIFEPDLAEGTETLFMLRDGNMMIESARRNSKELMEQIVSEGRRPVFGLYIDCAGRSAGFSDTATEEADEVRDVLNSYNTPLLGFYSGVEVAPLLGKSRGLDWTGVLIVLTEERETL